MINMEERKFGRLKRLGTLLQVPIPEVWLELEVRDRNGNLISRHKQRSHSWVENAYNFMFCNIAGCGHLAADNLDMYTPAGVQKTDNHAPTFQQLATYQVVTGGYGFRGAAGFRTPDLLTSPHGIVVGTSVNAESFDSSTPRGYSLGAVIVNGNGAGQMDYAEQNLYTVTFVALVKTATLIRFINNNSGGDITVNEVGIYGRGGLNYTDDQLWMAVRDLLGVGVLVPDTGQLKVTYTISLTYPA